MSTSSFWLGRHLAVSAPRQVWSCPRWCSTFDLVTAFCILSSDLGRFFSPRFSQPGQTWCLPVLSYQSPRHIYISPNFICYSTGHDLAHAHRDWFLTHVSLMRSVLLVLFLLVNRAFINVLGDGVVIYKWIWSPRGSFHVQDTVVIPFLIFWQYPDGSSLDDPYQVCL